jgi:hypothetical protein
MALFLPIARLMIVDQRAPKGAPIFLGNCGRGMLADECPNIVFAGSGMKTVVEEDVSSPG